MVPPRQGTPRGGPRSLFDLDLRWRTFVTATRTHTKGEPTMQMDQSTNDEMTSDTPTRQCTLFPMPESHPLAIRELLTTEQPRNRLLAHGAAALSDAELLAVITGVPCLETTQRLLIAAGGLRGLLTLSTAELQQLVAGISAGRAAKLKAAIELGRRVARGDQAQRRQIKSPADIADLLLLEMSHLDQEQLRTSMRKSLIRGTLPGKEFWLKYTGVPTR
jgi:hypothetical protein